MSGGKDGGDIVFNVNFDKETDPPPPAAPVAPPVSVPPPAPPAAPVEAAPVVPEVDADAKVPAVTPEASKTEPPKKEAATEEVVLDFTQSTAAPVTTGTIQPTDGEPSAPHDDDTGSTLEITELPSSVL